jgi:hypothetical protein
VELRQFVACHSGSYTAAVEFRRRLLRTLEAIQPVLEEAGVLVVGSEVPNLLEPQAAATLVVSLDVDLAVPVQRHAAVKERLRGVRGLHPSVDEPSVWVPEAADLIEVNFVGMDSSIEDLCQAYVLEDRELPLLVFGALSLVRPGPPVRVEGLTIPVPRLAGLLIEKLLTDRSGEKGERDLLVALALLVVAGDHDFSEIDETYARLTPELRHAVRSNLAILSLMESRPGMPDPGPHRARIAALLRRLERVQEDSV